MKKLLLLSLALLLSAPTLSGVCSNPKAVSLTDSLHRSGVTPQVIFDLLKELHEDITVEEFCDCFSFLCCDCRGEKYVKKDNKPCPPDKEIKKICCHGEDQEITISWYCCDEEEPPCPKDKCCEEPEPCDVFDCIEPNTLMTFQFIVQGTFVPAARQQLYEVIAKSGGKQCCEEYLQQTSNYHNCQGVYDMYVTICIHPDNIATLKSNWMDLGNGYAVEEYAFQSEPCRCQGR
jgi:hypothetical protein